MHNKRIIPCLDICYGRVVKGINFSNITDAGDPTELAVRYGKDGADELIMLDITSYNGGDGTLWHTIKGVAEKTDIPVIAGGGINCIEDMRRVLKYGAHKITINTAAVKNPDIISAAAKKFGSRRIIVAIDARPRAAGGYDVYIKGGSVNTGKDVLYWSAEVEALGAGEILLTAMDRDGTRDGYDLELIRSVTGCVSIPVIASGGAGKREDFFDALTKGRADAVLAASLFHNEEITVTELKGYLFGKGVPVAKWGNASQKD